MQPLIPYNLMYSCAALLVVLVLLTWGLVELHQRRNRYRLGKPDRSIRRHVDTEFAGRH